MDDFKQFRRKQIAELADWTPGFDMAGVSLSDADKAAGSPKAGDKVARNPTNHSDRWLVAADYFATNFESIAAPQSAPAGGWVSEEERFYLQDSRSFCGNDALWWRVGGKGYTSDLREAAIYTKDEAQRMHKARDTDIPWPVSYINTKSRPVVDFQYLDKAAPTEAGGKEG